MKSGGIDFLFANNFRLMPPTIRRSELCNAVCFYALISHVRAGAALLMGLIFMKCRSDETQLRFVFCRHMASP